MSTVTNLSPNHRVVATNQEEKEVPPPACSHETSASEGASGGETLDQDQLVQSYKFVVNASHLKFDTQFENAHGSLTAEMKERYQENESAYGNVLRANGDVSKISQKDFEALADSFNELNSHLQAAVKENLNSLFPGKAGTPGSAVGDAVQFAADGLKTGDADAGKNRFADLQKLAGAH